MTEKKTHKEYVELFDKEFLPHIDALNTFAFHLTYNESQAKDLVQDTYLKAFRFIDRYEAGTNAKAWLFKILKNAFINEFRKKKKRPAKVDFEEIIAYQDGEDANITGYTDLQEEIFENMMGDEVTISVNSLPFDFKTVILLCDVEGFTYEEISKILNIPIGTVRSRLFRARNMLKEKLKAYAQKMGYVDKRSSRNSSEEE